MNKKSVLIFIVFTFLTTIASEKLVKESFIAQPKQKKESRSSLNESIGNLIMQNAQSNSKIIEESARLEQRLLTHGTQLLSQEKNSIFDNAPVATLQAYRNAQQELASNLETCHNLLQQSYIKLNQIASSCKK